MWRCASANLDARTFNDLDIPGEGRNRRDPEDGEQKGAADCL
jgi:hypothetical protein